ncbi:2-keto-4-pentenoate hydratase [Seonamhaeicola maritimus]|uniref:2-keto-4-pentenoate hydratase n=1 Tax=Seonamhaeicola maritimus TaxID=2591822 RepID=UPI002495043E|nr:hypothetical protein [Seonamhaeicola maritimus]
MKNSIVVIVLVFLLSCQSNQKKKNDLDKVDSVSLTINQLADSLLNARHNHIQTDILSRHISNLETSNAYDIQFKMLERERQSGAKLVGWKLGGTATADSTKYNPSLGYILDNNLVSNKGSIPVNQFPGGSVVVEAEIGFVLKNDIRNPVSSTEELITYIDYVVGVSEIAQSTAIPGSETPLHINYVVASGMGHVAAIKGNVNLPVSGFDFKNETAKCYINDELVAEGVSSNIFGSPIGVLYDTLNMLVETGQYPKSGDMIITGSLYKNPVLNATANIRIEFSNLGTISFKSF